MIDLADLMRAPYLQGGRSLVSGIDCLGTVGVIALRKGLPWWDPWQAIRAEWERGSLRAASGFGPSWRPAALAAWPHSLVDGDVPLFLGRHHYCAILHDGYLWTASEDAGHPFAVPVHRWTRAPLEIWRHDPTAHQEGPAR